MTMMNLYDLAREYADVYGSGVSAVVERQGYNVTNATRHELTNNDN